MEKTETDSIVYEKTDPRIQTVLKNMLLELARICEKHGLRYFLIDGSMLGAVRHNGFIPWDDDIDVAMPRPDYEKLREIANDELPSNMYFVSYEESLKGNYLGEICHIFCKDISVEVDYFDRKTRSDLWIDIMIMYGMPENSFMQKIHYKKYYIYKGLARMGRIRNIGGRNYNRFEKAMIFLAKNTNLFKGIDTERILLKSVELMKRYPYDESDHVLVLPSEYGIRELVPKEYYEPGRRVKFEDIKASIPNQAESILKQLYGNYMQLPPVEERRSKHKITITEVRTDE